MRLWGGQQFAPAMCLSLVTIIKSRDQLSGCLKFVGIAHHFLSQVFGLAPPLLWHMSIACGSLHIFVIRFILTIIFDCICHCFVITSLMTPKNAPCFNRSGSFVIGSSKSEAPKEI